MKDLLARGMEIIGAGYNNDLIKKYLRYLELLVEYNSHTNITAIRDEEDIIEKHFLDSLLLAPLMKRTYDKAVDIGTGAGFPGMVLAIYYPATRFVLMDSVGKKTKFLDMVKNDLGLSNVEIVTARAEEYLTEQNRSTFDIGFCRGVAKLNIILEYMIPFLKKKGIFLAQKKDDTEVKEAANALSVLNAKVNKIWDLKLPINNDPRTVIEIEKTGVTPDKYPRKTGIPSKKPL